LRRVKSVPGSTSKVPEGRTPYGWRLKKTFYPRVRLTIHILNRRGDAKAVRMMLQDVRELVMERVRKMAVLLATRPDVINDQSFLDRLTPEEKALLLSMHTSISSFTLSVT
jgi:DNA replication factor GINS